eukprot:TRINITY_DN1154_c0_g1_i1.p1 TRINITY_DN1154_c0_g1~~TRINITY_DN1154_c0_g1_i1.p1  ORF type:complete len:267 (-),score=75.24 TRINITY_DN1154_c0_g1_i1:421-1221(-)
MDFFKEQFSKKEVSLISQHLFLHFGEKLFGKEIHSDHDHDHVDSHLRKEIQAMVLPSGKFLALDLHDDDTILTLKELIKDKEGIPVEQQKISREDHLYLDNEKVYSGKEGELDKHFHLHFSMLGGFECHECDQTLQRKEKTHKMSVNNKYGEGVEITMLSPESYVSIRDSHNEKHGKKGETHQFCPICYKFFDAKRSDTMLIQHLQIREHGLSEDQAKLYWKTCQQYKANKKKVKSENTHLKRKMNEDEKGKKELSLSLKTLEMNC